MNEFVEYVMTFYGSGGIYDMNATRDEVLRATGVRVTTDKTNCYGKAMREIPFEGDTIDRELVRDIIINLRAEG